MVSQTIQNFIEVGEPKIQATENLDKASRALCAASLEHFVTFSSFITGRGSPAVQNYGFANSYMERIFVQRHRDSLPGWSTFDFPASDWSIFHFLAFNWLIGNVVVVCVFP